MTKGELLVSIIKSLGYNGENILNPEDISLQDDYFEVTMNACESINRAVTRIYDANKLPKKAFYITSATNTIDIGSNSNRVRYDLKTLITDLGKVYSITYENDLKNIHTENVSIQNEGQYTVLNKLKGSGERYIIVYIPKPTRITLELADTSELPYTDEYYDKIIYFVKSEFLEETNTALAAHYRNVFEGWLNEADEEPIEVARHTRDVYGIF